MNSIRASWQKHATFCGNGCGAIVEAEHKFCPYCGREKHKGDRHTPPLEPATSGTDIVALCKEVDRLRSENERLQTELKIAAELHLSTVGDRQRVEAAHLEHISTLRKALLDVLSIVPSTKRHEWPDVIDRAHTELDETNHTVVSEEIERGAVFVRLSTETITELRHTVPQEECGSRALCLVLRDLGDLVLKPPLAEQIAALSVNAKNAGKR